MAEQNFLIVLKAYFFFFFFNNDNYLFNFLSKKALQKMFPFFNRLFNFFFSPLEYRDLSATNWNLHIFLPT